MAAHICDDDDLPTVVALGTVDETVVNSVLEGHCRFVSKPDEGDLAIARGAIVRASVTVDADALAHMPGLEVVARTGVGVERIDLAAATDRGIAVIITPGAGVAAVAEGAIAMALALVKRFHEFTKLVRDGAWRRREDIAAGDLSGGTIGVVGYGRIGKQVGHLARCLGMEVLAFDPIAPPPDSIRVERVADLVRRSDVVQPARAAHRYHASPGGR